MKRFLIIFYSVFLIAASACSEETAAPKGMSIYYSSPDGNGLQTMTYKDSGEYSVELIDKLIDLIQNPDEESEYKSVLTNGITVRSYDYDPENCELDVDLAGDFGSLQTSDKLILTAGLTLTFLQVSDIERVYLTIQGEALQDSDGSKIGVLDADDFVIHSGNEINIYISANLKLYFLDSLSGDLVPESRLVYYNSNVPLEQVVLEELIKGPSDAENTAVLPSNLDFLNVAIQDDICYVNFDENIVSNITLYDSSLALKSITQSIYEVCGVSKVQFSVNGDTEITFADGTSISKVFEADTDMTLGS